MKRLDRIIFLACGLLLTLAAFPVFAQEEIQINKKPFDDLAQVVRQQVDEKKVDLTKSFSIQIEGVLNKDGKLDPNKSRFTKSEGDATMIVIGKGFVQAINDSGLFSYLKNLGIEKMNFTLGQNDTRTYAVIVSEQLTAQKAATLSSGLNVLLKMAQMKDVKGIGIDDKILISGARVKNESKTLTINLDYEKSALQEMINRKLKESEIKQSSGK